MDVGRLVVIALGVLNAALLVALARFVPRYGKSFPWIVVLCAFFGLRTVERLVQAFLNEASSWWDFAADLALLPVLVALLLSSDRMVRGFQQAQSEALHQRAEYERARRDYSQLVRHRLFNPLTAIQGAATTLKSGAADAALQDQLLDIICAAAERIHETSLDPERHSSEEASLDAVARVDPPDPPDPPDS